MAARAGLAPVYLKTGGPGDQEALSRANQTDAGEDEEYNLAPYPHDRRPDIPPSDMKEAASSCSFLRIVAAAGALLQVVGAGIAYLGVYGLMIEGQDVKYNTQFADLSKLGYDRGRDGWWMVFAGFFLCASSQLFALAFAIASNKSDNVYKIWPEFMFADISRQVIFLFGDGLVAIAAILFSNAYPNSTSSLGEWSAFYSDRFKDSRAATTVFIIGASLRAFSIVAQFLLGERCNICYIVPFARCGFEWTRVAGDDAPVPTNRLSYYTICLRKTGQPVIAFMATFLHNWFGAIRVHIYLSSVLFLIGAMLYNTSTQVHVYVPYDQTGINNRTADGTILWTPSRQSQQSMYSNETIVTSENGIGFENDAGYYMYVSSIFLILAGLLQTLSSLGYFWGIVANESAIPRNHVKDKGGLCNMLCP